MFEFLIQWVPTELNHSSALFLIMLSAFTSLVTATLGIGDGELLIVAMAPILPPIALLPVYGFVQFGSNANRALMTYQHIDTQWVKRFFLGALIGAVLASFVGFSFMKWIALIVAMIASGAIGTYIGLHFLKRSLQNGLTRSFA